MHSIFFEMNWSNYRQDSPALYAKQQETRELHPMGALSEKCTPFENFKSTSWFLSRKYSDEA
jgi:hypothetical protein